MNSELTKALTKTGIHNIYYESPGTAALFEQLRPTVPITYGGQQ